MSIAFLSASLRVLTGNVNTVSFNCNPPSAPSLIVVAASWQSDAGGTTITGMTYNGVALTLLTTLPSAGGGIDIYYKVTPAFLGGSTPCVVNWSGTSNIGATIGAIFFTGSNQGTVYNTLVTSSGNSTTPSVTVTPKSPKSIPLGILFVNQGAISDLNITVGSGETAMWLNPSGDTALGTRTGGASSRQNLAGDGVMNWTLDAPGAPWVMVGVELLSPPAGDGNLMMMGVG